MKNNKNLTRREFLIRSMSLAGSVALSGCATSATPEATPTIAASATVAPQPTPTVLATATPRPELPVGAVLADDGIIKIINSGAKLPTEATQFEWIDGGGAKTLFWEPFFELYQQTYPHISTQYNTMPSKDMRQLLPLQVLDGTAPDVFPIQGNLVSAVQEGWITALDHIIPDFETWKARFPPGVFVEGITGFEGLTYVFPATSEKRYASHLLYNVVMLQEAGYDPSQKALTAAEFRQAAQKVTQNGSGNYYGLILGGNRGGRWRDIMNNFASLAGAPPVNHHTGQFNFAAPEYEAAIELILAMQQDGSLHPLTLTIDPREARQRMPQGEAGMILQGPWNIPVWLRDYPDLKFDVSSQPLLNPQTMTPLNIRPGGSNNYAVFANSPNQAIAGDIFYNLGSPAGQIAWSNLVGIADPSHFPEAIAQADLDPISERAFQLFQEQVKVGPSPNARNPEIAQVTQEYQLPSPTFGQVCQGLITGDLDNIKVALQDVQDRYNAERDRAIKAAQQKGAKVSHDDYIFANWDPYNDYGTADYAAL